MQISDIALVGGEGSCELRARVSGDALREPLPLWFRFPPAYRELLSSENGDPFVAALLLPAMRVGEPLRIPAPVSRPAS